MTSHRERGIAASDRRRGSALFAVVPLMILVMSLMIAFVGTSVDNSRANVEYNSSFRANAAAQNAASLAIAQIWANFETSGTPGNQLWAFRQHLNTVGLADQSDSSLPTRTSILGDVGIPRDVDGRLTVDGIEIERIDVHRIDDFEATQIVIEVDAVSRRGVDDADVASRASVQEIFSVAPPAWDGLQYAMLANNINCLLCHTDIDNAERYYNTNPTLVGTFDAVQLGSLETLEVHHDPHSTIAGRALIGGRAQGLWGNDINWNNVGFKAAKTLDGKIVEDGFGNLIYEKMSKFDPDADNDDDASLYLDFYNEGAESDHELPSSFPSPFPDNGGVNPVTGEEMPELAGNGIIDDSEFFATVGDSFGTLTGGAISVMEKGAKVQNNSALNKLKAGTDNSISGITDGNVYLHGTKDNPIVLSGDIAIDGDLILSGYVMGAGAIRARGNVYIPSDLIYADAGRGTDQRQFGLTSDGKVNSVALAAGGNVVLGDPYRPAWGSGKETTGDHTGSLNFLMDELAIFNRQEWAKTQETLPGAWEKYQTGTRVWYTDEKVKQAYWKTVKKWKWVNTGRKIKKPKYKWVTVTVGQAPYQSTQRKKVQNGWTWVDEKKRVLAGTRRVKKWRWVKTGKKIRHEEPTYGWRQPDVPNPSYDPDHRPRYYSFSEDKNVPIFNKGIHFDGDTGSWKGPLRPEDWNKGRLSYANQKNKNDPFLFDGQGNPIATVSTVAPTDGWIKADVLRGMILDLQGQDQSGSKTLEIDATLYSANSIMGMITYRGSSDLNGKLLVNGGIVAADVGLLAPAGTQVNHDTRGATLLEIASDKGLVVSRHLSAPLPARVRAAQGY